MSTHTYVISVLFSDRVGIVADVSAAIKKLGGNLAEVSQTVMRGYFTMILMAEFSSEIGVKAIEEGLAAIKTLAGAKFGILPFEEAPRPTASAEKDPEANLYVLTASGPDQPGIVSAFSGYLRERNINIVDLSSTNNNGEYTMIWLVQLPAGSDVSKLTRSMELAMASLNMKIGLRHHDIFTKTNEI